MPEGADNNLFARISRGTNGILALKILTTGLNLVITILLARYLDASGYGQYVLAITVISVLSVPTTLGLPNLLVRFTAKYHSSEHWSQMKGLFGFSQVTVVSLAMLLLGLGYLSADLYDDIFDSSSSDAFIIALFLLPLLSLSSVQGAAMRGLHLVIRGQICTTFLRALLLTTGVAYLYFFMPDEAEVTRVMLVQVGVAGLVLIVSSYLMFASVPAQLSGVRPGYELSTWLKTALPLLLLGGVQLINQQTDILMIGYFMEDTSVGVYQIAIRISELAIFLLAAANLAIGPMLSKLYHEGEIEMLQDLVTRMARYVSMFTIPVVIILYFIGQPVIEFVFGEGYSDAYQPLLILLLGQCINVLVGSVSVLLIMAGLEKMATMGLIVSAVINVVLNIALIPEYGINGAAVATMVSMVIWNVLLYVYCLKTLSINCSVVSFR